jgi:hypothetical protein
MIVQDATRGLTLETHNGLEAAMTPYAALVSGTAKPKTGHVVEV